MQAQTATRTKWVLDASHSELLFRVRHLMISTVKGEFKNFDATVEGEDIMHSAIHVTVEAASVFTNDEKRDGHLKSPDFFDVENYPELKFESSSVEKIDADNFKLHGNLTINGKTNPVVLDVQAGGLMKDPWGNMKAGYSVNGKINRKEWGLNWNAALETGGVLVSDEVRIAAEVQFMRTEV